MGAPTRLRPDVLGPKSVSDAGHAGWEIVHGAHNRAVTVAILNQVETHPWHQHGYRKTACRKQS